MEVGYEPLVLIDLIATQRDTVVDYSVFGDKFHLSLLDEIHDNPDGGACQAENANVCAFCLQCRMSGARVNGMASYNRIEVNEMIRRLQGDRSLRGFARDLKLSAAYLSDILRCNREPGPRLLDMLKLKRVKETTVRYVTHRKKTESK
jgi:hypothetical protein